MPTLLRRIYHGSKILKLDTGSTLLSKTHISFYCQYAKFSNAAKSPKSILKLVNKFCSLFFVLSVTSYFNRKYVTVSCYMLMHQATRAEGKIA